MELVVVSEVSPIVHEVLPHLYLGNKESRNSDYSLIVSLGIGYIPVETREINIPVEDSSSSNIIQYEEVLKSVHETIKQGTKVLIHCGEGVSRSVAFMCMYLIRYLGYSLESALQHIKKVRNGDQYTRPNRGFMRQLLRFSQGK